MEENHKERFTKSTRSFQQNAYPIELNWGKYTDFWHNILYHSIFKYPILPKFINSIKQQ